MHRRQRPVANDFSCPDFFVQLPLADLAAASGPLFSVDRNELLSVERSYPLIRIDHDDAEGELLLTSISGKSTDWSTRALLGAFLRMPLLTAGIVLRIHWQALRLWIKGVPFVGARPSHAQQPLQESTK